VTGLGLRAFFCFLFLFEFGREGGKPNDLEVVEGKKALSKALFRFVDSWKRCCSVCSFGRPWIMRPCLFTASDPDTCFSAFFVEELLNGLLKLLTEGVRGSLVGGLEVRGSVTLTVDTGAFRSTLHSTLRGQSQVCRSLLYTRPCVQLSCRAPPNTHT